jgi:hypothetical protein
MPGTTSSSPSTGNTFFHLATTPWMRLTSGCRRGGSRWSTTDRSRICILQPKE